KPVSVDPVEFWRPESIGIAPFRWGMPDENAGIMRNAGDGWGFANADAALLVAALAVIIGSLVENHPGIRRMRRQERVNNGFLLILSLELGRRQHFNTY